MSALKVIYDIFRKDILVQRLLSILNHLENRSNSTAFVWTPGHVGITGNEQALPKKTPKLIPGGSLLRTRQTLN